MAIETKSVSEKNVLREVTKHRGISPHQFTDILGKITIPTQRASIEFSPNEKAAQTKDVRAFIEWHQETGYTLAELRKYPEDTHSFSLQLPRERRQTQRDIIKEGTHPITLDIYEKKLKPGRGFGEFQEKKLPALIDAGYTAEAGVIILRDKGLLGSLDVAALQYKDGQLSLTMDNLLGSKKFTEQVTNWWNHLSTDISKK
jgi:hypothetical protein